MTKKTSKGTPCIAPMPEGTPRGWHCSKLSDVRRRLVAAIQQMEASGPTGITPMEINYYRALVYAYATLASVVRDSELEAISKRIGKIEISLNGGVHEN